MTIATLAQRKARKSNWSKYLNAMGRANHGRKVARAVGINRASSKAQLRAVADWAVAELYRTGRSVTVVAARGHTVADE